MGAEKNHNSDNSDNNSSSDSDSNNNNNNNNSDNNNSDNNSSSSSSDNDNDDGRATEPNRGETRTRSCSSRTLAVRSASSAVMSMLRAERRFAMSMIVAADGSGGVSSTITCRGGRPPCALFTTTL
jgi:hypothetical protein